MSSLDSQRKQPQGWRYQLRQRDSTDGILAAKLCSSIGVEGICWIGLFVRSGYITELGQETSVRWQTFTHLLDGFAPVSL
jgi:hypothetical protein